MTSILKVDTIQTAAGGTPTAADLGLNVTGSVLQVVSSGAFGSTVNVTSTSFVASGHNAVITTTKANSKILVTLSGGAFFDNGNASQAMWVTFYRSDNGGLDYNLTGVNSAYGLTRMSGDGNAWNMSGYSLQWLDAPNQALGSTLTYSVYVRVNQNSAQYNSGDRGTPVLTLTEIAG